MIPKEYRSKLDLKQTERAIKAVKDHFQVTLAKKLNLVRVSAPIFVTEASGLNDLLSGVERPVGFTLKASGDRCQIVQSLAKWKRMALKKYGFEAGEGLYTDMNAIRPDEEKLDNLHSSYVDQWDWEKIISESERTPEFLFATVRKIYAAFYETAAFFEREFGMKNYLPENIEFMTSQSLEDQYPDKTAREREYLAAKEYGAIFVQGIGGALKSGKIHDLRAPDYDDWALNGDIIVWYPVLNREVELSSMGIRVNAESLKNQLAIKGITEYSKYHQSLINGEYPLTIGGGIGQSRLCLLLLQKAHIAEVQASVWGDENMRELEAHGIQVL